MTSTNDGKDVKNSQILGQKAKIIYIELYKTLEGRLSVESDLGARTSLLCEAWRRVHCLCQHSAASTHPHLVSWLQRHTAQTILQSEWRQISTHKDKHDALAASIDFFILECHEAIITRQTAAPWWETQLLQRAEWFKTAIPDPWGNAVLKALLDPTGEPPSDEQIIEWLKEERGVFFVTRLRQLASSKKTVDIALSLATAVMERVRACAAPVSDCDQGNTEEQHTPGTFTEKLTNEAGFTAEEWDLITDIEFVLLYSDRSKCIALAKQTPLKNGYQLVERLHCRLESSSREKRLWKNAKDVATLIAQLMIARCMVVPVCTGTARTALYGCARSLVKLLAPDRLPAAMAALAAPAATARHLHTLAVAVKDECKNERKPFVCELFIRAITAGMNELERLKLTKEKESEARTAEKILGSWFTGLGTLLGASARLTYECALTAFSLHPSPAMYDLIRTAPRLSPPPVAKDIQEPAVETNSEFGSWATDSRSQTNFVKTSETLNLKKSQQNSNVLSTAVLNEGEALGLSPELCQDLISLLSGPRVKTLSWDMDKEMLIENCRSYMERTNDGTKGLTTELKYLNLDPNSFNHLPEETDDDEGDIFYGIEKGYEHLVELQEPEEIWEDAFSDLERTESCYSTENESSVPMSKGKKKVKPRRHSFSMEEDVLDPLSDIVPKTKHRSHSSESTKKQTKEHSKERSKERKKKERQPKDSTQSASKIKVKKDKEKSKNTNETDLIAVDVNKLLQKPKKERKKREKKEKKEQKQTSKPTGLSRLIGKKIIKPNMYNTNEQIIKRDTETDFNNQIFITDSDYDSQGKSSIASVHTEGNDPDVLFDGLFSMDDIKSPENTTVPATNKTRPFQVGNDNSSKRKSLFDSAIKSAQHINSFYMRNSKQNKELTRPSSATPSLARNVNETSHLPLYSPTPGRNETMDEVKLGIKRLIEFRKQKSATDLLSKNKHRLELERLAELNKRKDYEGNSKFANKLGVANRPESESRILPGSPKAISVPDIPKVFINKTQSQQLNHLKHEVDSYLLNQGNSIENSMQSQTLLLNNLKGAGVPDNSDESAIKSYPNLNKFEQKLYNMFHQSESSKTNANNVTNTSLFKESDVNTMARNNVSNTDKSKLHDFIKELQRSNNAGVSKNNPRLTGLHTDSSSLYSSIPTKHSAKQIKPAKKVENAPNTFARLKYMHKNKQGDNVCKQNSDHVTPNELHKSSYSEYVKDKKVIDTLLSRGDCTVIRKVDKALKNNESSSKNCPTSVSLLNVNQTIAKKAVMANERLIRKSPPPLISTLTSTQAIRTSTPTSTTLTNCNEDQLRLLHLHNSNFFITRPQITSEVVINKGVKNIPPPNSSLSSNLQTFSHLLDDEINKRLQGCPIKIQPCQSTPSHIQHPVTVKPKLSGIARTKEVTTKHTMRHKPEINNTKECNVNLQSEIKNDTAQQDWEKVLNDLLSHKTPSRGSYTQNILTNKDIKEMPSNTSSDRRIADLDSRNKINYNASIASGKLTHLIIDTAMKQNKQVIQQTSSTSVETNTKTLINDTVSLSDAVMTNNNAAPVVNKPLLLKANDTLKKSNHTIIKRLTKSTEAKLPYKVNINVPQTHTEPIITNVPSSEYDILGELMDDDLRQEIGELSSDEESFSSSHVVTKGKVKSLSNKLQNVVASPDLSCNLNVLQNPCTYEQAVPILKSDIKISEAGKKEISTTTSYETTNVIKSKPVHNTIDMNEEGKCQTTQHETKTCNIIHEAPSSITSNVALQQQRKCIDNNNSVNNVAQILDSRTSNICNSFVHNAQQSNVNCSNQNIVNNNSRLITSVNQNSGSVLINVPLQRPPVQNVVLIRPEIVYEPYTVQVHHIPETLNSNIGKLDENTFVTVNAIPTLSMFGAQFANPIINPVIISKAITVPITKNIESVVVNTCNNSDIKEIEKPASADIAHNNGFSSEQNTAINDVGFIHTTTNTKLNNCKLNGDSERNILSNVEEKQHMSIVHYPAKKMDSEKISAKRETCIGKLSPNNSIPVNSISNNSCSYILNENSALVDNATKPHPRTDIKIDDCLLNKSDNMKNYCEKQENVNVTTLCSTPNVTSNMDPKKSKVESKLLCSSFNYGKIENAPKNSILYPLRERCRSNIVDGIVVPNSKTNLSITDSVTKNNEKKIPSIVEENASIKALLQAPTINKTDQKSAEIRNRSTSTSKIQSATPIISNPFFSTGQCLTSDVIHYKPKIDVKTNECTPNKNCERKVLSEVQEKHTVSFPEKTVVKSAHGTEDEIKKDFLKTREERMIKKKTAILNRQIHTFSDVEPIPLSYAPINTQNRTNKINTADDDFLSSTKIPSLATFEDSTTNNESKNLIFDNINKSAEILPNAIVSNSSQSLLVDGSKENNGSNKKEGIRVRLRSFNKKEDGSPTLQQNEKLNNAGKTKTKVRLKVKKIQDNLKRYKCKAAKRLTKTRGHVIENNKESLTKHINKQNVVCAMPVSSNFDIEEQLQGSVISKDPIVLSSSEISNNKDVLPTIPLLKKIDTFSEQDQQIKENITDTKSNCTANEFIDRKSASNLEINQVEASTKEIRTQFPVDLKTLNKDDPKEKKEISNSTKKSVQGEHNMTAGSQKVRTSLKTCENDNIMTDVTKHGKSRHESSDKNKLIDSFKNNITIEEIPRKEGDDPLKRCISIKLANGNSFKATVSGKLQVNINSLFEDPAIRSVLMNKIPSNSRCILNIQQVISPSGENVRTRLISPKENKDRNTKAGGPLETINLISDDEDDNDTRTFSTEFGKYKIRGLNPDIFNNHQKRLSQKCSVVIQKCNKPDNTSFIDKDKNNGVKDVANIHKYDSESILSEDIRRHGVNNALEDKNLHVIEIDDSSNDSIIINDKALGIGTQSINTPDDIDLNIMELKETLLKDLCVDMSNKTVENNLPHLHVDIPMEVQHLKETLLKDLCDDLGDVENERLPVLNVNKNYTDIENDLKCVSQNQSVHSKPSDDRNATIFTIQKDQFVDSTVSKTMPVKSSQDIRPILSDLRNKILQSKRCQLNIEKCDELAKKYEILKNKRCFVSLERCDRLINSQTGEKYETVMLGTSNEDAHKITNSESLFTTEIDSSTGTLKRSGSFSILNEIYIDDSSLNSLTPKECNNIISTIMDDKCETEDFYTCQSDWLFTKSSLHCVPKQVSYTSIIPDDISTDCDSDHDDNSSNISDSILDVIESASLPIKSITYQVPSLVQVALKYFIDAYTTLESNEVKSSKTNCSLQQHLKRKSNTPERACNGSKHMKFDEREVNYGPKKMNHDMKYTVSNDDSLEISKLKDVLMKPQNSLDSNIQPNQKVTILPLTLKLPSNDCQTGCKNTSNDKHLVINRENIEVKNINNMLPTDKETTINEKSIGTSNIDILKNAHSLKGESFKTYPTSSDRNMIKHVDHIPKEVNAYETKSLLKNANNLITNTNIHTGESVSDQLDTDFSKNTLNLQQDDEYSQDTEKRHITGVIIAKEKDKFPSLNIQHREINVPTLLSGNKQCVSINNIESDNNAKKSENTITFMNSTPATKLEESCGEFLTLSDSPKTSNNILNYGTNNKEKTEALAAGDMVKCTENNENLTQSEKHIKIVADEKFKQLELGQIDSVRLFKTEQNQLCVNKNTKELDECFEYEEKNDSVNLITNDNKNGDVTSLNDMMEIDFERNVLKQQHFIDNGSEINCVEEYSPVSAKITENVPNRVEMHQAGIDSNKENKSYHTAHSVCDIKLLKESSEFHADTRNQSHQSELCTSVLVNSAEEYDEKPKRTIELGNLAATNHRDNVELTSSLDVTHIETHYEVIESNEGSKNDIMVITKDDESFNCTPVPVDMKYVALDSNQGEIRKTSEENTASLKPHLENKSYIESLHDEEILKSKQCLIRIKNEKENDVLSARINETKKDVRSVVQINANVINDGIQSYEDMKSDLNQMDEKDKDVANVEKNKLVTNSATGILQGHNEPCNEVLAFARPNLVYADNTKKSEVNKEIYEIKIENKVGLKSEYENNDMINESHEVKSPLICATNQISQIDKCSVKIDEDVSSTSCNLDTKSEITIADNTIGCDVIINESHSETSTVKQSNDKTVQIKETYAKNEINPGNCNKKLSDVKTLVEEDRTKTCHENPLTSINIIPDHKYYTKNIDTEHIEEKKIVNIPIENYHESMARNDDAGESKIFNENITSVPKNNTAKSVENTYYNKAKRMIIENNSHKSLSLSNYSETNMKADVTRCDDDKDLIKNKVDETSCPKNITLLYKNDSVLLKGSIIKNPIVGTCYVFPIINKEALRPVLKNDDDTNKDTTIMPELHNNMFQDADLIVTKPKVTYSKIDLTSTSNDKPSRRNLKRKTESTGSKLKNKKYRKGKNIDHPKVIAPPVHDFGKEFKNLSNYCDSIKFSYTKQYHLTHLDDVHSMLQDWPIKESNLSTSNINEIECDLFIDIEQKTLLTDPTEQTLAEEILKIYDESESTSPGINETNFSMGFGEGSGRVDQNLIGGEESIDISAVTLSDVKQSQPFLQSIDNHNSYVPNICDCRDKQMRILDKYYSHMRLRDQVQSFFRKTTAELNHSWLKYNFKSEKRKCSFNDILDTMTSFPFDLNIMDFFEPPLIQNIVQVVQVGQLPVSTGAQNPVTCDPRVTQVSDASPPQCSVENDAHDDMQPTIKTEYTELTTADISMPLMSDYDQHHQGLISATPNSNIPVCNDNITIETEVKIEVLEEGPDNMDEQGRYDNKDFSTFPNNEMTNTEYSFEVNDIKVPIKTEDSEVKIVFEPAEGNVDINHISETYENLQHQQNVPLEKPDQLAHAMSAAGITATPEPIEDTAMDLSNSLTRGMCSETDSNNYQRSNVTAMTLQHALAHILPSSLNTQNESESNPQVSVASQILHIVHGKNNSLNQIKLTDNTQQSVISTATPTPVLHIVQSKNGPTSSSSNDSPVHNSNSYSGLSLVDTGLSQGGNQLLRIVNTGNQKSNNGTQLLKGVNLLTNLTNVQGSNEQKMVQFVCKSADAKGIPLNTNQRSMVLRLHTIDSQQSTSSKPESQDISSRENPTKESVVPQELKSRSVYEETYAKFIQTCNNKLPVVEKYAGLPKFNQAFGKPVFQEDNQKSNEIDTNDSHLSSENNHIESNDGQSTDNSLHLDNIRQIASPPLLLRKSSPQTAVQQNIVQQIKQAITPMNIQTMHGGVIYTRQIPVNIGGGQTINLITVPSTERTDDSAQKQKPDVRSRSEIEPSIIKIVPQSPAGSNSEISVEENNNSGGVSNDHNSQPPPMLTQMRIKLPMLSKNPQMVSAARVVRPSFFQIQRNVIGGPNQPVYQQLVLTAAPTIGQQSIRLPQVQTSREMKVGTESQTSPESQMSSSTLEQLREFDMVLEQVKERSTVQPNGTLAHDFSKTHVPTTETSDIVTKSTSSEVTQQVLYSIGNNQSVNVAYVNRKSTVVSTSATTSFARSPDSSSISESPTSSTHTPSTQAPHTATSESTNGTHPPLNNQKSSKVSSKSKSRPKTHHPQFKINSLPPKPSNQKPMEDEQTTQRILYILAEYKEQVENSPDKDKPAPRRRTNLQAAVTPPGGSRRKKSSSGSRRSGRDSSPLDENYRTMGSEDSSCGTSQGDCSESCQELHSPQGSPRKVAKKLSFEQDSPVSQPRPPTQQTQPQPVQSQLPKQPQPQLQRNVLVTDGPTIAVTRAAPGKPATAVLMPANYILPVSMVKSGQQIAIVTNRGPKILTVGGGEGGATNALLLQRLINPTGLKPVLARPGVRHVRLPTTALHNLSAFNLATAASAHQPTEAATSPVPATSPPELIDSKAPRSSWTPRHSEAAKPDQDSSPERPDQEHETEPEPDPDPEPWNVPHDYSYEETVRTEMDRTVLDAIPDRYSPDMEAQRIFDKMFDVESKKGYIGSQDDSPRCPYDIDASDCDDKAYHQVVQRRDGVSNRHRFVSAATLRQKFALMEDELRLQKSLSEECEDLGVDSPSASDLFPEAELLFSSSPAHEVLHHTPQPVILNQSNVSKPDLDDQAATDQLITRDNCREDRQTDDIDLGLEDVGIVTVSEDGMRATISLDHEEFARSHPNTTFHSELTEEGEVQPVTLADLRARHITSTIFHAGRAPATVLVTAPQTTVISQATPDGAGVNHVRCSHADQHILNETRELSSTSAIIHSTGNATQVIRRVCYERNSRYFLEDDLMNDTKIDRDPTDSVDDDRSTPERQSEAFWERRRGNRRDFSSDSDKCCKSPYEENSTDSTVGVNMRHDSVIKDARGIDRSESSVDDGVPPLRTYPPKRTYHDSHRSASGKSKAEGRSDSSEGKRRASNRGVVKRGCHCCNGTPAPSKPKKPRHKKPTLDFN